MDIFRTQLLKAIKLCNKELQNRKRGIVGESTVEQLEGMILPELNNILNLVDKDQLPAKEQSCVHTNRISV